MQKQAKVEIRLSQEEKDAWIEAAGGPRRVSAWARAVLNAAAHPDALEEIVTAGAKVVVESQKTPLSTSGMIVAGSSKGRMADSESVGAGSTPAPAVRKSGECPRARFHRSGTYCGTCARLIK